MKTEELHGADGPVSEAAVRGKYTELTLGLIRRGLTITTMESCTSGQIASLITDTEGSSAVLKGAFVTYSNEAKIMQGVPAAIIGTYGVYSAETAAAMAEACRAVYGADIGRASPAASAMPIRPMPTAFPARYILPLPPKGEQKLSTAQFLSRHPAWRTNCIWRM